ncbi:hypothetical protein PBI_DEWDROP_137 [Microbacterium phage Dewdrop]|nr:hypothetical protein PBI_LEAF_137 [Microbacterium phage Leaf]QGZ17505.1 hypothetical protein PBI_DEWDROP_137 [Microbacterium phage Dewdrop]
MARTYSAQKAALTRAMNKPEADREAAVVAEARRVKQEWGNAWPDDWSRWQRALDDVAFGKYDLDRL